MELAKAFEPAEIERRWYPEWESRNYFAAGVDRSKHRQFLHPAAAAQCYRHAAHGPWLQPDADGCAHPLLPDARPQHAVATGHRPRRHCDADRRRAPTGCAGHLAPRSRPRKVLGKSLGMEGILRQHHHQTNAPHGHQPGLEARTLHDGCRPQPGGHRNLRPALQRGPDLPRQAPGQLGSGTAHRRLRPRSRLRGRGRRLHVAHPLPAGRRFRRA